MGARRRRLVRHDRRDEGPARAEQRRAGAPHRVGRAQGRRRQRVHRDRPSPLVGVARTARHHPGDRPAGRARAASTRLEEWRAARDADAVAARARRACARSRAAPRTSCPRRSRSARPAAPSASGPARCARCSASTAPRPASVASRRAGRRGDGRGARAGAAPRAEALGRPIRLLVGKPGLDGHSNGAEQIAVAARDAGMEVVYQGIRLTPERDRGRGPRRGRRRGRPLDPLRLAPRAGARDAARCLRAAGVDAPVVVGGIIPDADRAALSRPGVARVYTPKDFRVSDIVAELAELVTVPS